jgi:hypothetical protein
MSNIYNIYCDESCHLENDHQKSMVLGAVWCLDDKRKEIFDEIRNLKKRHGLSQNFEIKWTKVSPAKIDFYLDVIDYFFYNKNLHFRCLVAPDKNILDHEKFNQTHDSWYYKMYFDLLKVIIDPDSKYRVYIDIKDTNGGVKIKKLHEVLSNSMYDFDRNIIERLQIVKSDEIELIQLADLLIGAMSFVSRSNNKSLAKKAIIQKIKEKSGYDLNKSTLIQEEKFNILIWRAS